MFDVGSALVKPYMRDILREIGSALGDVENRIALAGHTDATPYGSGERGYSNWELSADRANASRRELVVRRSARRQAARGWRAWRRAACCDPKTPTDPINRRISILVMTQAAEEPHGADRAARCAGAHSLRRRLLPAAVETSMAPALQIPAEVTKSSPGSGG